MKLRRRTIEHVFGTLKHWIGSTHFQMKTLVHVSTEVSLLESLDGSAASPNARGLSATLGSVITQPF
jgi:hypothetical protein